jgi:DNA polymerase-3 subunit delta
MRVHHPCTVGALDLMIYLFLDCNEYLLTQRIRELKAAVGDAELADLNITEWEGGAANANEILGQASMMPFLTMRRLIVLRGYLSNLEKRMSLSKSTESAAHLEAAHFLGGLADVTDTCDLVLIENSLDKRRAIWKGFRIRQQDGEREVRGLQALVAAKTIVQEELATPDAKSLPSWIQQRARALKITVEPRAVQLLASFVGGNLRQVDNELDKLSLYAGQRSITEEDVKLMVSDASEALIWNLTDALSQRNPNKAMHALHDLRRGDAHPIYLLTMIARQYRVILKVKEAMRLHPGANEYDLAKVVRESAYPVKKAMQLAGSYSFAELVELMDRFVVADNAMKTGADPETEIDLLIAELTQKAPAHVGR